MRGKDKRKRKEKELIKDECEKEKLLGLEETGRS
jgi:hypothetical protein